MVWLIGFLMLFVVWRGALAWNLYVLDRRAATRGWPLDLAALDAFYRLPPGAENAADDVLAAGKIFDAIDSAPSAEYKAEEDARQRESEAMDQCFARMEALRKQFEAGEIAEAEHDQARDEVQQELDALWKGWHARQEEMMAEFERDRERHEKAIAALKQQDLAALDELLGEREPDYFTDDLPDNAPPLPAAWRAGIQETIQAHQEAIPHLERAAEIGAARFPIDFNRWKEEEPNLLQGLWPAKRGVQLFQRMAIRNAEEGNADAAVEALVRAYGLAQTLEREPTVMSQMAWHAMQLVALKGVAYVLGRCALTSEHLDRLERCIERAMEHDSFGVAWSGERCLVRLALDVRNARPENDAFVAGLRNMGRETLGPDSNSDELPDYLKAPRPEHWRLIYEIPAKLSGLEALACVCYMRQLESCLNARRGTPDELLAWLREDFTTWPGLLAGLMVHPEPVLAATVQLQGHLTAAATALQIERHRLDTGALPDRIADLQGAHFVGASANDYRRIEKFDTGYSVCVGPHAAKPSHVRRCVHDEVRFTVRSSTKAESPED